MDLCLVINTCKGYYSNITELIKQIKFPKENILIVSGQENEDETIYENGIKVVKVKYTGLHLTSAIYINENIEQFVNINYWLLLPDTIKFGDNFFDNIMNYYNLYLKDKEIYTLPFINRHKMNRPTMDMGIVHTKQILNVEKYLKKIKTYDLNRDNLVNLKRQLIFDEDFLMLLTTNAQPPYATKVSDYISYKFPDPIYFIIDNADDMIESRINDGKINEIYFKPLDLYKYQRNFNGPYSELILSL